VLCCGDVPDLALKGCAVLVVVRVLKLHAAKPGQPGRDWCKPVVRQTIINRPAHTRGRSLVVREDVFHAGNDAGQLPSKVGQDYARQPDGPHAQRPIPNTTLCHTQTPQQRLPIPFGRGCHSQESRASNGRTHSSTVSWAQSFCIRI
jgi:hypothetical protein